MAIIIPGSSITDAAFNGQVINGVAHFVQTTAPTTRADGSILVAGDRWAKSDDGTEWFWNGTYWLSPPVVLSFTHSGSIAIRLTASSSDETYAFGSHVQSPFISKFCLNYRIRGTNDASNYWTWGGYSAGQGYLRNDAVAIALGAWDTTAAGSNRTLHEVIVNQTLSSSFDFRPGQWVKVGSAGEIFIGLALIIHSIAP